MCRREPHQQNKTRDQAQCPAEKGIVLDNLLGKILRLRRSLNWLRRGRPLVSCLKLLITTDAQGIINIINDGLSINEKLRKLSTALRTMFDELPSKPFLARVVAQNFCY